MIEKKFMNESFQNQRNNAQSSNDDVTMKDIFLKLINWLSIIRSNLLIIILISLVFGLGYASFTKFIKKPIYIASYNLIFQSERTGMSGAMRLASSFGFSLGGGNSASTTSVQEYLISRDNISKALTNDFSSGKLVYRFLQKSLEKKDELAKEFREKFGLDLRYTDSVITEISMKLNEDNLKVSLDEESGILHFTARGNDESLIFDLSSYLVQNTEEVFIKQKKKKSESTVFAFQEKVDSLELVIDSTLRKLGEYEDQNNLLVSSVDKMKRMRLSIEMEALKVSYGEYIKGLEMAKADLMNLDPPFQYYDAPTYPLFKKNISFIKSMFLGSAITGFALLFYFVGVFELRNVMKE